MDKHVVVVKSVGVALIVVSVILGIFLPTNAQLLTILKYIGAFLIFWIGLTCIAYNTNLPMD